MKNTNYFTVQGWMVNEMSLSGNELLVYAIIYGFSQDGESKFSGSARYIAECLSIRKATVLDILARLVEKGCLRKIDKEMNGIKLCDYEAIVPAVRKAYQGGTESVPGGGTESVPHINNIDKKIDKNPLDNNKLLSSPKGGRRDLESFLDAAIAGHSEFHYLRSAMLDWLKYKRDERKKNYKSTMSLLVCVKKLHELANGDAQRATKIVEQSIAYTWDGFYALKEHVESKGTDNGRPLTYRDAVEGNPKWDKYVPALEEWLKYQPCTNLQQLKAFVSTLACYSDENGDRALAIVQQSIAGGWHNIRPLDRNCPYDFDIPKGPKIFDPKKDFVPGKPL